MKLPTVQPSRPWRLSGLFVLALLASATTALAFRPVAGSGKERLAVGGHDVVAYHTEGKARTGHVLYRMEWEGAVWQFHSRENLIAFRKAPRKFAPVFGGYCTVSVADAKTTYVCSGKHFLIHEGELYIAGSSDALKQMRKDPKAYIARAQPTWDGWVKDYEEAQREAGEGEATSPDVPAEAEANT